MRKDDDSLSTPIAFFIFNRPDLTEIVFDAIRKAKPKKLLVVADGPRSSKEEEKCRQARAIIERVNWDCQVLTNFSEVNLGCKHRVSSGLDWVFLEVEEAIILEDDCLPTLSFFYFCQTLLEHYRHEERIFMISGDNFQSGNSRTKYSYYFSKYSHIWGWASWRRAWQHYDVNIKTWPQYKKLNLIRFICKDTCEQKYWINVFDRVFNGAIDTWDYQWLYTCWSKKGLSILPDSNLVSNIGFRPDATHVSNEVYLTLPVTDIWEIRHPPLIVENKVADEYTFDCQYGGKTMKANDNFLIRCRRKVGAINNFIEKFLRRLIHV